MDIAAGFIIVVSAVSVGTFDLFQISNDNLDKALGGHAVLEVKDINHHECALECMYLAICKSIDYDRTVSTCKINDVDRSMADPLQFENKKGSIFSDINEWPKEMVKSCGTRPCLKNQKCYVNSDSYVCKDIVCPIGQHITNGKIEMYAPDENQFLDYASVKCNAGFVANPSEVKCQASGEWQQATCQKMSDCQEILREVPDAKSGLYDIVLWQSGKILTVNCDMETDGGGWTIFHRRMDGSVDFYRNFTEYENGFGNVNGELWIGLKYIQELADQGFTELRLDMATETDSRHEIYQDFRLTDGIKYKLGIKARVGQGDDLYYNNGGYFSTFDRDLDPVSSRNCAVDRHGAWWYITCTHVNLNGLYIAPGSPCLFPGAESGLCCHMYNDILTRSSMMLRRK